MSKFVRLTENTTDSLFYQTTSKSRVSVKKRLLTHEGIKRFIDILG